MISASGKYIYYESSSPRRTGDKIVLRGPMIPGGSSTKCMKFAYHMYSGSDGTMGKLQLDQVNANGSRTTLFSQEKINFNWWQESQILLSPQNYDYHVNMHCL